MASLRDLTRCNPHRKDSRCASTPAFAGQAVFDFSATSWQDNGLAQFWATDTATLRNHSRLAFDNDGVAVRVHQPGDSCTLASRNYLLFGRVRAEIEAAAGAGVVTSLTLKSDSGDEIDWEMLGAFPDHAQTNFFANGNALYNAYAQTHNLSAPSTTRHLVDISWSDDAISITVNDALVRSWHPGDLPAALWPQKPMRIVLGVWAVGPASDAGEIRWAGGVYPPQLPAAARFRSVRVLDLAGHCVQFDGQDDDDDDDDDQGGDNGHGNHDGQHQQDPQQSVRYSYDERTWDWRHVRVAGCQRREKGGLVFTPQPEPTDLDNEDPVPSAAQTCPSAVHQNGARACSPVYLLALVLSLVWQLLGHL
ncbi:hypothetical protein CDD82_7226 [Ophiocordyceps australis]|uniref:GH16 domain-containing protein n=1 Tax=Ophiocordyceps australis TaxID=1399860 RepID=A0A2C5YTP6_9HYPO|nr:hypothetical protein CDD82_7226 [Ophiocordyceps australis]